jgi:hypothetical protein
MVVITEAPPEELGPLVAEHALGLGVDENDSPLSIDADDRVRG